MTTRVRIYGCAMTGQVAGKTFPVVEEDDVVLDDLVDRYQRLFPEADMLLLTLRNAPKPLSTEPKK